MNPRTSGAPGEYILDRFERVSRIAMLGLQPKGDQRPRGCCERF